jgi:phosphohistidine phosphatase
MMNIAIMIMMNMIIMSLQKNNSMKTLLLVRHAKSSWTDEAVKDIDRTLNDRGKYDAPMMGKRLAERNIQPDVILSSPAKRAKKTAQIIADEIEFDRDDIVFVDRLYLADIPDLIRSLHEHHNNADVLMMFGHNPGMTDFSNFLSDSSIDNVPTCGIATIEFEMDSWDSIEITKGKLVDFDYPKRFMF